jgi:hypothetical protein
MLNSRANGTPECIFEILLPNRDGAGGGRAVTVDGILLGVKAARSRPATQRLDIGQRNESSFDLDNSWIARRDRGRLGADCRPAPGHPSCLPQSVDRRCWLVSAVR